jgi:hypothetical protein
MKEAPSFVEALRQGLADYDDIDDYIDEWHDGPYRCEIYEFLGMTRQQYFNWLEGGEEYLRRTFPKGELGTRDRTTTRGERQNGRNPR